MFRRRKKRVSVFLFGAGSSGVETLKWLSGNVEVLGFLDNAKAKHGTVFEGIPVFSPSVLLEREFDYVVLSSMYAHEILEQLLKMGIERSAIIIGFTGVEPRLFPWDAVVFLALVILTIIFGTFVYLT
jgi:FlaA1/EpsC-like NDP-sugar epimerase